MSNNEIDIENKSKKKGVVWIICTILFVFILIGGVAFAKSRGKNPENTPSGKISASSTDSSPTDSDDEDENDEDIESDEDDEESNPDSSTSIGSQMQITVKWQKKEYTGIYTGELKKGKPSGEGTFVSDNEKLTYSGDWEKGKFNGSGTITYTDGSYETGSYEKGKRHGKIKEYTSENEYSVARYNEDVLYGTRVYYKDGEEVDTKRYYKGKSLSSLEKKAIKLTPEVIKDRTYINKTVYIEGTVCFSGETSKSEYLRIETDSVGMVIARWYNNLGKYLKQPLMPMMKAGDKVKIFGTYDDVTRYQVINDAEAFGYDYPEINPTFGYITEAAKETENEEGSDISRTTETDANSDKVLSYKELLAEPFLEYTRWVSGKYVVKDVLRIGKKIYIYAAPQGQEKLPEEQQEIYVLFFNADGDEIIKAGDTLKVSGYLDGQYKTIKDEDRTLFEKQKKKTHTLVESYSGIKIDLSQVVFTYDYDIYPAIHVYKWKKK